jgi:dual oxidase
LILFRWHNIQAKKLKAKNPDWTDEELFQGARRIVIATLQVDLMGLVLNLNWI